MGKLLQGKTAVVTGGGRSIGKEICEIYAKNGADVVVIDRSYQDKNTLKNELCAFGTKIRLEECDVTDRRGIHAIIADTQKEFGGIDIWVNNAGVSDVVPINDTTPESWKRVIDINLTAVFFCSQAIFEVMKQQNHGKIINIASLAGERGGVGSPAYSAAKAGVIVMTKCFALNGGEYNINVNNICPGLMLTEMTIGSGLHWLNRDNGIPLVRFGTAEDVAGAALFYASSLSDYVTGDTVDVNGGLLMR